MKPLEALETIFSRLDIEEAQQSSLLACYKTIEEALKSSAKFGIDIAILHKALTGATIYLRDDKYKIVAVDDIIAGLRYATPYQLVVGDYYSRDRLYLDYDGYGTTWALSEEELLCRGTE